MKNKKDEWNYNISEIPNKVGFKITAILRYFNMRNDSSNDHTVDLVQLEDGWLIDDGTLHELSFNWNIIQWKRR